MPNANIDPHDIYPKLEQRHRDVMIDLILTWASLDNALGILLSQALEISFVEGADLIGKCSGSTKFHELRKLLLKTPNGFEAAKVIKKHKKSYEHHSFARNRIAHAHCAGVWTRDRDFVVFAAFEKYKPEPDALALDGIPLQEMRRAIRWGIAMKFLALKLAGPPKGL